VSGDIGPHPLPRASAAYPGFAGLLLRHSGADDPAGGDFFAEAIAPIENTHRAARQANDQLVHLNQALHQRSAALATSNLKLKREIAQRKLAEESLRKSEQHYAQLLEQSRLMGRPARAEWQ